MLLHLIMLENYICLCVALFRVQIKCRPAKRSIISININTAQNEY